MKLSAIEFGKRLLDINDLDPLYVALHEAQLEPWLLQRWLLAFWGFYHSGTASWVADGLTDSGYWDRMEAAAGSKEYPRCHERRHYRGENARKSVAYLREVGIDCLFEEFDRASYAHRILVLKDAMEYVQEWVGFGPWISFKVADMLERLNVCPIQFDDGAMFLFDSPKKGARMMWEITHGVKPEPGQAEPWAVKEIIHGLRVYKAPPRYERRINCQEAETVLCKWKSYMGGHYEIGEDVIGLREGLERFKESETSQRLLQAAKDGGLW